MLMYLERGTGHLNMYAHSGLYVRAVMLHIGPRYLVLQMNCVLVHCFMLSGSSGSMIF